VPDIGPDAEQFRKIFAEMSLTPTIRAEQLSIDQFLTLTGILRANRLL
jgi:16S rRNA A1518/A1519 N6-dimethyltransferase RsmA/KsgA/DIM1 with predicted DNA glycosylase/AP lyase activity